MKNESLQLIKLLSIIEQNWRLVSIIECYFVFNIFNTKAYFLNRLSSIKIQVNPYE